MDDLWTIKLLALADLFDVKDKGALMDRGNQLQAEALKTLFHELLAERVAWTNPAPTIELCGSDGVVGRTHIASDVSTSVTVSTIKKKKTKE